MRFFWCVLMLTSLLPAQAPSPAKAAEGWLALFDGETLFGWTREGAAEWRAAGGVLTATGSGTGRLRTNALFGDYVLRYEFRADPKPVRWRTYELTLSGGRAVALIDGKRAARESKPRAAAGPVVLEAARPGTVEFRNIRLKPLGLRTLFDGKTLTGWRTVDAPKPPQVAPEWSVRDGLLHVEHGPGGLESEALFGDFVLQLEVRANAPDAQHHPNSGVFFRAIPGGFWTGYEAQIRNEWENGDRSRPVDFGTGGIYRNQPARRVVSTDGEFFTMTVAACGRHLAVWVDGYPVSDWDDPHPAGDNVRKGEARLAAGAISLQAHDPTTNLDFRNLRAAGLVRDAKSPVAGAARPGRRMRPHGK
jgi:hypothetical protein